MAIQPCTSSGCSGAIEYHCKTGKCGWLRCTKCGRVTRADRSNNLTHVDKGLDLAHRCHNVVSVDLAGREAQCDAAMHRVLTAKGQYFWLCPGCDVYAPRTASA